MKVIISLPESPEPNLTLLTPQPGAGYVPLAQSNGSSDNHPLALPFINDLSSGIRVLSVWKTLSGFELRTSQTATDPSCDVTANFVPFEEKAVENEAAREDGM